MRNFSDEEVITRVESHAENFIGWKKGMYYITIRSKADKYNVFDDKGFLYQVKADGQKPVFCLATVCTTNAGSYGLKEFAKWNPDGCAVLKSDCMVYNSHKWGLHRGKPGYRQQKGFPHFRDNNKNERAEEIGPEDDEIIYANIHRSGVNSTWINNWSVACVVIQNLKRFFEFMRLMEKKGKPDLSLVILREW